MRSHCVLMRGFAVLPKNLNFCAISLVEVKVSICSCTCTVVQQQWCEQSRQRLSLCLRLHCLAALLRLCVIRAVFQASCAIILICLLKTYFSTLVTRLTKYYEMVVEYADNLVCSPAQHSNSNLLCLVIIYPTFFF